MFLLILPLTRPNSTCPPALWIRSVSFGSVGLWSFDNAIPILFVQIIARESPALLYYIYKTHKREECLAIVISQLTTYKVLSFVINATIAVHPDVSFLYSKSIYVLIPHTQNITHAFILPFCKSMSIWKNAFRSASLYSPFLKCFDSMTRPASFSLLYFATFWPYDVVYKLTSYEQNTCNFDLPPCPSKTAKNEVSVSL